MGWELGDEIRAEVSQDDDREAGGDESEFEITLSSIAKCNTLNLPLQTRFPSANQRVKTAVFLSLVWRKLPGFIATMGKYAQSLTNRLGLKPKQPKAQVSFSWHWIRVLVVLRRLALLAKNLSSWRVSRLIDKGASIGYRPFPSSLWHTERSRGVPCSL